jgi:hypothetical protein
MAEGAFLESVLNVPVATLLLSYIGFGYLS